MKSGRMDEQKIQNIFTTFVKIFVPRFQRSKHTNQNTTKLQATASPSCKKKDDDDCRLWQKQEECFFGEPHDGFMDFHDLKVGILQSHVLPQGLIIHFFDVRSPSIYRNRYQFLYLVGAFMEHFFEGIVLLRHWCIDIHKFSLLKRLNGALPS